MKNLNSTMILLLTVFALAGVGCGQSNNFQADSVVPDDQPLGGDGVIPPPPDGDDGVTTGSNVVDFKPVSIQEFNSYVAMHPLNDPKNFKLTVDLHKIEGNRFCR